MAENKKLIPGKTLSLRLPKNIRPEILDYINQDREINRNKHMLDLLCTKIEEEIKPSTDKIVLELPKGLKPEQVKKVQNHLNSLLMIMVTGIDPEETDDTSMDLSMFDGLIEEDD